MKARPWITALPFQAEHFGTAPATSGPTPITEIHDGADNSVVAGVGGSVKLPASAIGGRCRCREQRSLFQRWPAQRRDAAESR